jgi:ribonuclease BN (tRNA processing enzyme)
VITDKRMTIKIKFLGTGSAINAEDIGASILINENILIDAPGGIAQAILKFGGDISKLDTIIITHLHGDHFFGLPFLLLEYMLKPRETPLNILAPAGAQKLLIKLTDLAFPGEEAERMLAHAKSFYIIHDDGKETISKNISIRSYKISHGDIETYGIEFWGPGNKKIFYAPDTSYSYELVKIIETIDIAILDATTSYEAIDGHMSMKQVNDLAKQFLDKVFILTHRSRYDIPPTSYSLLDNVRVPVTGDTFTF